MYTPRKRKETIFTYNKGSQQQLNIFPQKRTAVIKNTLNKILNSCVKHGGSLWFYSVSEGGSGAAADGGFW